MISKALEPFWTFATTLTPRWLAPNAITLLGFGMIVVSFAIMLAFCPTFDGSPPSAAYAVAIVSLFGFQTLDAIDGKQARRTGSSSPVGNWLDHVCDVVAMQLAVFTVACSLRAGVSGLTLFLVGSVLWAGYVLHWETKHTGVLFMGNGTSIHEAQLTLMAMHAVSWVFGPQIWSRRVGSFFPDALHWLPQGDATLRAWLVVVSVGVIGGVGIVGSVIRVVRSTSGSALRRALVELVPAAHVLLAGTIAFALAKSPCALLLMFAVSCLVSRLIGQMVLSHLADVEIRPVDAIAAPLTVSALYLAAVRGGFVPAFLSEAVIGWGNLVFAFAVSAHYLVGVTREMSKALAVPILTLPASAGRAERVQCR